MKNVNVDDVGNHRFNWCVGLFFCLVLTGCSSALKDYAGTEPRLDLRTFFSGQLHASGMVQDGSGLVIRRFRADIVGQWQGNTGVLDEIFYFDDGEIQTRCWILLKEGDQYTGRAGDVVGLAVGQTRGNTMQWQYELKIPVGGREWVITMDDWLYLIDENNLLNRTSMKKWGIEVGQLTLHIGRKPQGPVGSLSADCQFPKKGELSQPTMNTKDR